jgi:DNA-directed RNA polymerase specialized sigma24 family protein
MPTNAIALTRLLLTERLSLLRLAQRIVGTAPAAEDVTQSLWFRVQRIEARRVEVHEEAQALLWGADHALAADRAVIANETLRRIEAAIAGLPEQTRRIFELHRYEGLTQRALADRLGISTTAVEKHMRRAMRVLAEARDGGS